jgi:ABC-2 type transport system permease protein
MSTLVYEFRATYAFMERNANLVKRYLSWEVVWLAYSIANSLSVSFIGMGMEQMGGSRDVDGRYLVLFLVIGTLVWRYLSLIFYWITDVIGMERWEGTIEYTLMAPVRRVTHMAGQTIFAVAYSLVFSSIILVVTVLLFDIDMTNANILGGILMLIVGSLSFIGVGIMGSVLPLLFPERGSQMTHDYRRAAAGVRCLLPGERFTRTAAEISSDQSCNLCTGWCPACLTRRNSNGRTLVSDLAHFDHGFNRYSIRSVGFRFG